MKVQAQVLRLDVSLKCRPHGAIDGENPLVLHISAPPFDTQASASLQAASVDRSTSGPVAIHKSL